MVRLCWREMRLMDVELPAGEVSEGRACRLVMPANCQHAWLDKLHAGYLPENRQADIWLETNQDESDGNDAVWARLIGMMLNQRGALANLSIRENLMLPLLYDGDEKELAAAARRLPEVAEWLDIQPELDAQAGELSACRHALIGLGRLALMRPKIIVLQDVCAGLQPDFLDRWRGLFAELRDELNAGVLVLSASAHDALHLEFDRSLELAGMEVE